MKRILLLLVATILSMAAAGASLTGVVVGVADGDTVTVLDQAKVQHRIRLLGIDAPEKAQEFGSKSKQSLSALVYGKTVVVEYAKEDQYGRILGKVSVGGADANLAQIKAGMAWHYKRYEREQEPHDRMTYAAAEVEARSRMQGLWVSQHPTPPWAFRRGGGEEGRAGELISRALESWRR